MAYKTLICYSESIEGGINTALDKLSKLYNNLVYWYISHDRDINENGELKKQHYHVVLDFDYKDENHNSKEKILISNIFGISSNQIQIVKNVVGIMRYLTHRDNAEKEPYSVDEVISNDTNDLLRSSLSQTPKASSSADDTLEELFCWVDSQDHIVKFIDIFNYMRKNKLFFMLSSQQKIIDQYREYHNQQYLENVEVKYEQV